MRIIAGSAGGRRLVAPEGPTTRPTTDRVREATFNALFSLELLEGHTFCDLFAGSGALGLEALSRGATHVTFVERDRASLEAIETNVATLKFESQSTIVKADSMRWIANAATVDVVLADPPYGFAAWDQLAADAPTNVLVAESGDPLAPLAGWDVTRERTYGSSVVTILRRTTAPASPALDSPQEHCS